MTPHDQLQADIVNAIKRGSSTVPAIAMQIAEISDVTEEQVREAVEGMYVLDTLEMENRNGIDYYSLPAAGRGGPSKKPIDPAKLQSLAAEGLQMKDIAAGLGVSVWTLRKRIKAESAISDALNAGKEEHSQKARKSGKSKTTGTSTMAQTEIRLRGGGRIIVSTDVNPFSVKDANDRALLTAILKAMADHE